MDIKPHDQEFSMAGVRFLVRGVPSTLTDGGRPQMSLDAAKRMGNVVIPRLATLGVCRADAARAMLAWLGLVAAQQEVFGREVVTPAHGDDPKFHLIDRTAMACVAAMVRERAGVAMTVREHLAAMAAWTAPAEPIVIDYDPNA